METVHIHLAGPYEVSICGSVYMIMFIDITSRWMRPCRIKIKYETITYVQTFIAATNGMR